MLIHIQFPIADLRGLASDRSFESRLQSPGWPNPLSDEEFIRSAGVVRKRFNGGLCGWVAEGFYCDARNALKITPTALIEAGLKEQNFEIAFRRLYFDGTAVAKLEIGFSTKRSIKPDEYQQVLAKLFNLEVCVASPRKKPVCRKLTDIRKDIEIFYSMATRKHRRWKRPDGWFSGSSRLVVAGAPVVFIDAAFTGGILEPATLGNEIELKSTKFRLFHSARIYNNQRIHTWLSSENSKHKSQDVRNLRVYLLRLHAEVHSLVRVLKAISNDEIKPLPRSPSSDALQIYLNDSTANLLSLSTKTTAFAAGNDNLLLAASSATEAFLSASERASLLQRLRDLRIRKNIFRKVSETSRGALLSGDGVTIQAQTVNIGKINMSDKFKIPESGELTAISVFGAVFIVAILVLAFMFPHPTSMQYLVMRIVLAVATAGVATKLTGFINIEIPSFLRAGGAFAVFVIVFFYNPAALVAVPPPQ